MVTLTPGQTEIRAAANAAAVGLMQYAEGQRYGLDYTSLAWCLAQKGQNHWSQLSLITG